MCLIAILLLIGRPATEASSLRELGCASTSSNDPRVQERALRDCLMRSRTSGSSFVAQQRILVQYLELGIDVASFARIAGACPAPSTADARAASKEFFSIAGSFDRNHDGALTVRELERGALTALKKERVALRSVLPPAEGAIASAYLDRYVEQFRARRKLLRPTEKLGPERAFNAFVIAFTRFEAMVPKLFPKGAGVASFEAFLRSIDANDDGTISCAEREALFSARGLRAQQKELSSLIVDARRSLAEWKAANLRDEPTVTPTAAPPTPVPTFPEPSPIATSTPPMTPTATGTQTATPTRTATRTPARTATPTRTSAATSTPLQATPTATATRSSTPTGTRTATPTATRFSTPSATRTATPTATRTPAVIGSPTPTPTSAPGSTFYIAPTGDDDNGSGTSASPWASFARAYASMRSGDTLVVKDGVYLQQDVLTRFDVRPPSGTSGRYTIIRAEHPGQAIIDGGGTMSPISLDGPPGSPIRYIQFDGLVFRHQTGAGFYQVDHIKLTRCGFEDAADGNSHTVAFGRYSSYILVEDCYAWGSGRYKFSTYHADHVVFRRNVVRFDRANAGGEPIAGFAIYASVQVEVQNCISIDGDKSSFWQNVGEYSGSYSIPSTDGPSTNIAIRGSIALNVDMQFGTLTKNLDKITIDDSVGWHLREGGWLRDSGTYDHCTFGDFYGPGRQAANVGFQYSPGDDPVNALRMTNSVLTGIKGTALTNFATENFNVFSGNTADRSGTTKGAQSVTANPGLQYLLRADPGNAVLSGTASDGGNRGATILKKIGVTGTMWGEPGYDQVTTEDLWPFPNEDIIRQHMRTYSYQSSAGTLSGNRGFCADGQTLSKYIWGYLGATSPY